MDLVTDRTGKEVTGSDRKRKNASDSIMASSFRCKSPYVCYTLERQYKVAAELGPNASVDEIARKLAVTWHKMSQEEREPWIKRAKGSSNEPQSVNKSSPPVPSQKKLKKNSKQKESKSKTKKEKAKKSKKGPKGQKASRSKKEPKDPTKPKRPMTAYIIFSQKMRPEVKAKYPHLSGLGITKHIGELWNKTTEKEREPYQKIEGEARRRYQIAMEEWRCKKESDTPEHVDKEKQVNKADNADRTGEDDKLKEEKALPPEDSKTTDNDGDSQTEENSQAQQDDHTEADTNPDPSADDTAEDIVVEEANPSTPGGQVYMMNPAQELQANMLLQRVPMPFLSTRAVALPHVMARIPGGSITGAIPMVHLPTMQAYFINQGHSLQRQMGSFSRNQG